MRTLRTNLSFYVKFSSELNDYTAKECSRLSSDFTPNDRGIVFCMSVSNVQILEKLFVQSGISAIGFHGGLEKENNDGIRCHQRGSSSGETDNVQEQTH